MRLFYDNVLVLVLSIVAGSFAWFFGGTRGDVLTDFVPWLIFILLDIMFCFPQRHYGETTYEARARVWASYKKDPLTWLVFMFIILLTIPFLNKGLCPSCDYVAINIENQDPSPLIPFAPFCVNLREHLTVFLWFIPALLSMLAIRHSLCERGKRSLLKIMVWNGALLAVLGLVQQVAEAPGPLWCDMNCDRNYFFSTFGYPNMAGDYFFLIFGLSVALWRWDIEVFNQEKKALGAKIASQRSYIIFWKRHLMLIPALLSYVSAIITLSRAAILLSTAMVIIFTLHAYACAFKKMSNKRRVRSLFLSFFVVALVVVSAITSMPDDVQKEVETLNTTEILDRVSGRGQYHARVAAAVWRDNFLFGCGGWGYKHFCIAKMTEDELRQIQMVGGINVHNDYLQILAEHGIVGLGMLIAMVVLLLKPLVKPWKRLMKLVRFMAKKDQPPHPFAFFVLPAPIFCILTGALATLIHAFGDCPLRSPAVLILFFMMLATLDAFMPSVEE